MSVITSAVFASDVTAVALVIDFCSTKISKMVKIKASTNKIATLLKRVAIN
ncbi:hypothetical protein [Clostridium sp.]|uniref:hypothetical protein n=1 Tax=Clostridium sp. TaxID=1506 RepID=UPI003D6CC723